MTSPEAKDPHLSSYLNAIRNDIQNDFRTSSTKKSRPNLTIKETQALRSLQNDDSIQIKPADKGGAIVLMDKDTYINKCYDHLNDTTTYKKISIIVSTQICNSL